MKRNILLFALIISFVALKAQDINQFDANQKRHGIWKKNFKNDRIRYHGEFNHGKEVGVFKFYSAKSSDHPTIIKKFNVNDNNASVKFYSISGVLESEGEMNGKKRLGKWVYFHKDGKTLMQEEFYVNNELDGDYKTFFPDKKPAILTTYSKGKINGNYKRYAISGKVYQDLNYTNGKLNGEAIYYDRKTGLITESGQYKDDERIGSWKVYIDGEFSHSQDVIIPKKRKNN